MDRPAEDRDRIALSVFLAYLLFGHPESEWTAMKTFSKYLLALFMVGAGTLHFIRPDSYLKIMPPYLPWPLELVYLSGFFEVGLGVLLLVPRFSRLAAWSIIALLIAVFRRTFTSTSIKRSCRGHRFYTCCGFHCKQFSSSGHSGTPRAMVIPLRLTETEEHHFRRRAGCKGSERIPEPPDDED
jgi:uncharacterized membrane protein YphA (DoxX/SURF4 family)